MFGCSNEVVQLISHFFIFISFMKVHFEEDDSVNDKMPHTERDEKLRKVRMSSRRKSVVM